jgi:glutathione S-transferase
VLDAHLQDRKWLVGNDLTIAEFAVGAPLALSQPAQYPIGKYAAIRRWYDWLASLPAWQRALAPIPG